MRHTHWVALSLVSIAGAASWSSLGCSTTADNCANTETCDTSTTTGTTTSSSTSTGMGGTGGTGGTGGVGGAGGTGGVGGTGGNGGTGGGPGCTGEPVDSDVLSAECGIFVALGGMDDAAGSPTAPVQTLAKAIELAAAQNKRVYACAEDFDEVVVLDVGVTIYGGLGCDEFATMPWTYVDENSRTGLRSMAGEIPLTLNAGASGSYIEAFTIEAAAGMAPGGSSIAVVADAVTATMTRCELVANNGANGATGESPPPDDAMLNGINGTAGVSTCMAAATNPGPAGPVKVCSTGGMSTGGKGGDGGLIDVVPTPHVPLPAGNGTSGTTGTMGMFGSGEAAADCTPGMNGSPGTPGASAAGGVTVGTIAATGYVGASGQNGTVGLPAQGGGGGGGAKGGLAINCGIPSERVGSSGGTGGTGGCGGLPGNGGLPGGSSIALISLDATLTLTDVTLTAGQGGDGGNGGNAQNGGVKGDKGALVMPVTGATASCAGGDGGVGGKGGPGGGGAGGHSLGIAYTGTLPVATIVNTMMPGNGGNGGMGNNNPNNNGAGVDGLEQDSFDFMQ